MGRLTALARDVISTFGVGLANPNEYNLFLTPAVTDTCSGNPDKPRVFYFKKSLHD
jgi:hypothetical protein